MDTPSREAIASVGRNIVERDESRGSGNDLKNEPKLGVADNVIGWLHSEAFRISGKGTSRCANS